MRGPECNFWAGKISLRAQRVSWRKFVGAIGRHSRQGLRAGHRRRESEGQKENLNRVCQARPQAVLSGSAVGDAGPKDLCKNTRCQRMRALSALFTGLGPRVPAEREASALPDTPQLRSDKQLSEPTQSYRAASSIAGLAGSRADLDDGDLKMEGASRQALDSIVRYRVNNGDMRSSEVATQSGVNVQTLRYYERRGLLEEPPRSGSGYRAYPADAVAVVRFIKRAQEHGFTLDEIEELLHLADGGPDDCAAARELAAAKMAHLAEKIADLQRMQQSLAKLVTTCDLPRADRCCPLIQTLHDEGETR